MPLGWIALKIRFLRSGCCSIVIFTTLLKLPLNLAQNLHALDDRLVGRR